VFNFVITCKLKHIPSNISIFGREQAEGQGSILKCTSKKPPSWRIWLDRNRVLVPRSLRSRTHLKKQTGSDKMGLGVSLKNILSRSSKKSQR